MPDLIDSLKEIRLAIFDLDGVVYRGNKLIENADKIISQLKSLSIRVIYNSNNSTVSRQNYVERLKNFKIPSVETDFYTSASIASAEITKIRKNANVYVIGEKGLREELQLAGHRVETNPLIEDIDFVIVGLDRDFTYEKLSIAQKCIIEGKAQFYATNADSTLPVARGLKPGAGSMVNALITCTGQNPIRIFGKPEPFGIEQILHDTQISPKQACIFGDRLNTDILAGNRAGIMSIAVLTGVTTKKMIEEVNQKDLNFDKNLIPDIVLENLGLIFKTN
ncbi:MAG: HAD-IIA family hydrolase [Candidatus Hodarchaeales archaeon]|jgi:4-nitrophenyl phosphatase